MKRGVSNIVLAIGVVILIFFVLYIGLLILSPLVQRSPRYIAEELATSMDAAYAAPGELDYRYKPAAGLSFIEFYANRAYVSDENFCTIAADIGWDSLVGSAKALVSVLFDIGKNIGYFTLGQWDKFTWDDTQKAAGELADKIDRKLSNMDPAYFTRNGKFNEEIKDCSWWGDMAWSDLKTFCTGKESVATKFWYPGKFILPTTGTLIGTAVASASGTPVDGCFYVNPKGVEIQKTGSKITIREL